MDNLIPLKDSYLELNNAQIAQELEKEIININLYPILAMRMQDNPIYKQRLLHEAVKATNMNMRMAGIIKASWIPIMSIIDYGTEKDIVDAVNVVKSWPSNEIINIVGYLKDIKLFIKHFPVEYAKYINSKNLA